MPGESIAAVVVSPAPPLAHVPPGSIYVEALREAQGGAGSPWFIPEANVELQGPARALVDSLNEHAAYVLQGIRADGSEGNEQGVQSWLNVIRAFPRLFDERLTAEDYVTRVFGKSLEQLVEEWTQSKQAMSH